ncbi:unnamed protein product [Phytophthora fragariaefolia]|uniref:Unnamed protein product n=1 Tax=Phytophthora fragariaefolia TaxID=1490495 RepID=A0A9W6XK73_9STRA|nr:unnamed protein product [Phytophthora fragariaefolia]
MRACVVCAGLRSPGDTLSTLRPQGILEDNSEVFFTGFRTRLNTRRGRQNVTMAMPSSTAHYDAAYSSTMVSPDGSSLLEQHGLWTDDEITAARIPRSSITIQSVISRGAYGLVHLGIWKGMQVAVKTLLPESRKSIMEINQFLAEAKMIAAMEHPSIVNLIGVAWESLSDVCMVVEYMDGGDLRSLLNRYERDNHPIGFDTEKLGIAMNVCHALTYLHSLSPPVLHRDLKSRNILLNRGLEAKVTDFGVSRQYVDQTMTAGVGTCLWMAPEVIMGMAYDGKADIFSFGIVLSELDKHSQPYSQESSNTLGSTLKAAVPAIRLMQGIATGKLRVTFSQKCPQAMVELGEACTALDPAERPSAAEALYRLQCALRDN